MNPNEKIRSLIDSGWTQSTIAAKLAVSRSTIMRYQKDQRRPSYALGAQIMRLREKRS